MSPILLAAQAKLHQMEQNNETEFTQDGITITYIELQIAIQEALQGG